MKRARKANNNLDATSSKKRHVAASQDEKTVVPNNASIRNGKIIRIHLTNFMCHTNLVVDFNRQINFLVGSNGSGKSAILTALVVGLGTRAKDTNRSTNIKQFIKNGEISSTIEIEIANDAPNAFDWDTYGNKITVIRQISDKGVSQYKIKNEFGQVISKRTDELHKILLYHNIQPDNPVFVLNQDSARSFLKELDPTKNYQLFLKATQIEIIMKKLNECGLMYNDYKYRLQCHNKQSEPLKQQVAELTEKYESLRSLEDIKANITEYQLEMLWVKVSEQEKLIEELSNEVSKKTSQREKMLYKIRNKDEADKELRNMIRNLEEEIQEKNLAVTTENEKLQGLRNDFSRENERYLLEQRQCSKLQDKIKHFQQEVAVLEAGIAECSESSTARVNRMREKNEAQMAKLSEELKEIDALIKNAKRELDLHANMRAELLEQLDDVKGKRQQAIAQISFIKTDVDRLAASAKDSLSVYGRDMSAILLAIERVHKANHFSALPRGPIGKYVQVPNEKWRGAVEFLLGGVIHAFLVNTTKDRLLLDKIIKEKFPGVKITIITSKFHDKVYDVHKGMVKAPRGTSLLMDEIKCLDPVIMNCLIDQANLETILLTEDQNLATNLTSDVENVPRNLRRVILLNPFLDYRPAPMYRAYSLISRPPKFLQVDISQRKRQLESEIEQNNQLLGNYESQIHKIESEIMDVNSRLKQFKGTNEKNETKQQHKQAELVELQNVEYPSENEVEILTKELVEIQNKLDFTQKQLEDRIKNCAQYSQSKNAKEKTYSQQNERIQSIGEDITRLNSECDNLKLQLHSDQNKMKRQENIVSELEKEIKINEKDLNRKSAVLQQYMNEAQNAGERISSKKTEAELENIIKKLDRKVKTISSTQGNINDIKALLEEKRRSLEKNQIVSEAVTETLDLLKMSRVQRFRSIVNLKKHMALKLKYTFDSILRLRDYTGELNIDHVEQKLALKVIPRDNHIENAVSNTESLSGGERSYTTVAFLLSLWSCVDHPFYFLDEYDVFTDQVNRQIMSQLLLNEAQRKPHRQYTFLTPQDMSFIDASDTIKIHRLIDHRM